MDLNKAGDLARQLDSCLNLQGMSAAALQWLCNKVQSPIHADSGLARHHKNGRTFRWYWTPEVTMRAIAKEWPQSRPTSFELSVLQPPLFAIAKAKHTHKQLEGIPTL